jgi:hypothetical protein
MQNQEPKEITKFDPPTLTDEEKKEVPQLQSNEHDISQSQSEEEPFMPQLLKTNGTDNVFKTPGNSDIQLDKSSGYMYS